MSQFLYLQGPLINSVMGPELARYENHKKALVAKHHRLGGGEYGFYYMGHRFTTHEAAYLVDITLPNVHPELTEEVQLLFDDIQKAEHDFKKLSQALSVVLPKCQTLQDVRDTLHEVFIRDVPRLRSIPRVNQEGYILDEHPMLKRQYMKAVEIAEYYTANKLIY